MAKICNINENDPPPPLWNFSENSSVLVGWGFPYRLVLLPFPIGLSENIFIRLIRNDKRKCQKKTMWALICLILVQVYSIATDSFDVTLVYEDNKYNQAHKVVLATSSA